MTRREEGKSERGVNVGGREWWGGESESSNSEESGAASESVGNQLKNKIAFYDFLGMGAI